MLGISNYDGTYKVDWSWIFFPKRPKKMHMSCLVAEHFEWGEPVKRWIFVSSKRPPSGIFILQWSVLLMRKHKNIPPHLVGGFNPFEMWNHDTVMFLYSWGSAGKIMLLFPKFFQPSLKRPDKKPLQGLNGRVGHKPRKNCNWRLALAK